MNSDLLLPYSKYQIRLHGNSWENVSPIMQNYLDKASMALVFHHKNGKEGKPHFHIYLINIAITEQAIRKYLKNYFKGNKAFSLKSNAGRTNKVSITPYDAYQYGSNDSKDYMEKLELIDPIYVKGISDSLLQEYKEMTLAYYEREIKRIKDLNEANAKPITMYREKADCTWERLFEMYEMYKRRDPQGCPKSYHAIKRWIELDYLNRCKPTPRPADLHRYAKSLSLIRNGMVSEEELIAFNNENI